MTPKTIEFLKHFGKTGKAVKDLSRIRQLLEKFDNLQDKLNYIHVAGTNGKGSTVEMISQILIDAGYKTGQFTSPFILHYNDRIRINSKEIPDNKIDEYCQKIMEKKPSEDCSQFEITFLTALMWFVENNVDVVCLEAGLGGLLDCTNIIKKPLISIITTVSLDHTKILGDTAEKIAVQKAGIIKPKRPVLIGALMDEKAKKIIIQTANEKDSPVLEPKYEDFSNINITNTSSAVKWKNIDLTSPMPGKHQIKNIETAVTAAKYLKDFDNFNITEENIKNGIKRAEIPGRCQYFGKIDDITVYLDGGHNPEGVEAFCKFLAENDIKRPIFGLCGMIDTKDYKTACKKYNEIFDKCYIVDGFMPNSVSAEKMLMNFSIPSEKISLNIGINNIIKKVSNEGGKTLCICGSLYLVSCILGKNKTEFKK